MYRRNVDNIDLEANGALTRGDAGGEHLEVNIEQGTIDNLEIKSKEEY